MEPVQAIYENGILRPLTPLGLPEHAHVTIAVIPGQATTEPRDLEIQQQALNEIFAEIQKLPQAAATDGFSNRDHDKILYGSSK